MKKLVEIGVLVLVIPVLFITCIVVTPLLLFYPSLREPRV